MDPMRPLAHPWKAAENFPASEPATTIWILSSDANFGEGRLSISSLMLAALAGSIPAPEMSSAIKLFKGTVVTSWMRLRISALL